ncbi:hypothetical protein HaLaN_14793, partial [Haematococcus lacustris]
WSAVNGSSIHGATSSTTPAKEGLDAQSLTSLEAEAGTCAPRLPCGLLQLVHQSKEEVPSRLEALLSKGYSVSQKFNKVHPEAAKELRTAQDRTYSSSQLQPALGRHTDPTEYR